MRGATTVSTIDLTYDSTGRVTEEKVTKTGPTVTYDKQYTYDKVGRRLTCKDVTNGNWLETSTFDASGRLTRIVVTAGTGSNPFSWPKGTTNVTCDANGNITQLVGRNVDTGAIWKVAHQFDYEQRVTKVLLDNGDTVQTIYDGQGYKIKELVTSGGSTTEKRFVQAYNYVIQERDGTDTVTARYYWDSTRPFKKDHGSSAKYFVPEFRNSPFTAWNNAGTFNRYDLWDSFGVEEDQSAAGSLSPFERHSYQREASTHLTRTPQSDDYYPEIGKRVRGRFVLKFARSPGKCELCETMCCALAPIMDPDQEIPSDCWLGCGPFCETVADPLCTDCCCLRVQQQRYCPGAGGSGGPPVGYDWVANCPYINTYGVCDDPPGCPNCRCCKGCDQGAGNHGVVCIDCATLRVYSEPAGSCAPFDPGGCYCKFEYYGGNVFSFTTPGDQPNPPTCDECKSGKAKDKPSPGKKYPKDCQIVCEGQYYKPPGSPTKNDYINCAGLGWSPGCWGTNWKDENSACRRALRDLQKDFDSKGILCTLGNR